MIGIFTCIQKHSPRGIQSIWKRNSHRSKPATWEEGWLWIHELLSKQDSAKEIPQGTLETAGVMLLTVDRHCVHCCFIYNLLLSILNLDVLPWVLLNIILQCFTTQPVWRTGEARWNRVRPMSSHQKMKTEEGAQSVWRHECLPWQGQRRQELANIVFLCSKGDGWERRERKGLALMAMN